jgi:hypothetical protein
MKKIVSVSLAILGLVAQANAATVTRESGPVSLSNGSKYVPVTASSAAMPGDLVRTGKKGRAFITLDCGDRFEVGPGRVMRVPPEACAAAATAPAAAAEPGTGLGSPMVLAAGAAAAVGVGAAAAATNGFSSGSSGPNTAEQLAVIRALQQRQRPVSP